MDYTKNNFTRHNPYAVMKYMSPFGLYIDFFDSFLDTDDPYGSENDYGLGKSTKRQNNDLKIATGFIFAEYYAFEIFYRGFIERFGYHFDEWQNVNENTFGASLFYRITTKTQILFEYNYRDVEYPEQNDGVRISSGQSWSSNTSQDYEQNLFFIGAQFSPLSKVSGEIKLGYGTVEHKNNRDLRGVRYEEQDSWVAKTKIEYKMRERTTFALQLKRSYKMTASELGDAPGYFDTLLRFGVEQKMKNRLKASLDLDWNTLDYQKPGTEEFFNIYRIKAGLTYDINKWLDTGIFYKFKDKSATKAVYEPEEYTVNTFMLNVTAKY